MIKRIAIVIIGIIIVVVGRGFFLYSGSYSAPPSKLPSYEHIKAPPVPLIEFADNYTQGEGTILIDLAHENNFDIGELNVLTLRLLSRGLTIKFLTERDNLKKELLGEKEKEEELEKKPFGEKEPEEADQDDELLDEEREEEPLGEEEPEMADQDDELLDRKREEEPEEELPGSFIIVCPQKEFSKEDKKAIDEFIDNDGKLLLIADPTRRSKLNSLSLDFGLIFEPDYLYNMKENEINYRNIFVSGFKENELTKNLGKIALYIAGSISSDNSSIAFVDENTFSSVIETRKGLSPIALAQESKVLAIYDLTFITEPYNGILDNNQLISNIADWLARPAEEEEEAVESEDEA